VSYDFRFVKSADADHFGANVFGVGKLVEAMWDLKIYGTNDGWIITPAEIRAALNACERHPDRDTVYTTMNGLWDGGRWQAWIDYLTRAAEHHGIEVS